MNRKVLVIAPHPDDETIGCGGTLLKHKEQGHEVYWCIITGISEDRGWGRAHVETQGVEIEKVSRAYNFNDTIWLHLPSTELDTIPMKTIIGGIAATLDRIAPQVVYLPFGNDIHTDHQIVYKASISALKTFRRPTVQKIMAYETLSETEFAPMVLRESFMPNIFVDISDQIERKKEIFSLYSSEIMGAPFPRSLQSIESLAGFRGSRVCRSYSEAFMLLLEIA